jgi:amidase
VPAVAVPTGTAHGLPQGVQVIGAMYREDLCLEAAAVIEGAVGPLTPIDPR